MISHTKKCIFIHIPKCGGTSVETFLKKNIQALGWEKEAGLEYEMRQAGLANMINLYPSYFTFTFTRNPFDRFVSIWKHSERGRGEYWSRPKKGLLLREYAYLVMNGKLAELSYFDKYHSRKQVDFILGYNSHLFNIPMLKNNCDFIGRFENLQNDFKSVCETLGVQNYKLNYDMFSPNKLKPICKHYSSYYDQETLEIVSHIYAEDIKMCNYKFEKKLFTYNIKPLINIISQKMFYVISRKA